MAFPSGSSFGSRLEALRKREGRSRVKSLIFEGLSGSNHSSNNRILLVSGNPNPRRGWRPRARPKGHFKVLRLQEGRHAHGETGGHWPEPRVISRFCGFRRADTPTGRLGATGPSQGSFQGLAALGGKTRDLRVGPDFDFPKWVQLLHSKVGPALTFQSGSSFGIPKWVQLWLKA